MKYLSRPEEMILLSLGGIKGDAYAVSIRKLLHSRAGALALAIALLTISLQALRAALSDPVRALRYE